MDNDKQIPQSALKMEHIVFDELSFNRLGFRQKEQDNQDELPINISVDVNKLDACFYHVTLRVEVIKSEEYSVKAQIAAYCQIDDDTPNLEVILRENTPAILFPYVRAQLSMLTSQPETIPLVLPVVNIHEMMSQSANEDDNAKSQ